MLDSVLRAIYSTVAPAGAQSRLSTLIFHRVLQAPDPLLPNEPTAAEFEARMRWVQRHFNVIPLAEAIERLQSRTLPTRSLAITFDDGYADNEQIAAPILRKLGLPATFFIATGYLDGGRMFNDSIIAALRHCRRDSLDLTELGLGIHSLESIEQRRSAISVLLPQVKILDSARRIAHGRTHLPTCGGRSARRFDDDLIASGRSCPRWFRDWRTHSESSDPGATRSRRCER